MGVVHRLDGKMAAHTASVVESVDARKMRISQKPDRGSANSRTVVSLMSGQFVGDGPLVALMDD